MRDGTACCEVGIPPLLMRNMNFSLKWRGSFLVFSAFITRLVSESAITEQNTKSSNAH